MRMALAVAATLGLGGMALAADGLVADIDVSGWTDLTGADIDLGGGFKVEITGIGWDVNITADAADGAWFSDGVFSFGDVNGQPQIFLTPGAGSSESGENQNFSSGGIIKLADVGLPPIQLDSGVLALDYNTSGWNTFMKEDSHIFVQYNIIPAPGALALVGLAGLASRRRRA